MEIAFVESQQSFVPHLAELIRHGASVDRQEVGELLAVKWNGKRCVLLCFCIVLLFVRFHVNYRNYKIVSNTPNRKNKPA